MLLDKVSLRCYNNDKGTNHMIQFKRGCDKIVKLKT